ncbi:hypothetical protein IWX46DRAFT_214134 [Phyllosticta citricarpa]|uniref:Uncharacterized protein n=1 Tax=Phyllosticta citricarpa TaxID=55181 RepID=A0ABR1MPJ3_9PEZI
MATLQRTLGVGLLGALGWLPMKAGGNWRLHSQDRSKAVEFSLAKSFVHLIFVGFACWRGLQVLVSRAFHAKLTTIVLYNTVIRLFWRIRLAFQEWTRPTARIRFLFIVHVCYLPLKSSLLSFCIFG